MNAIDKIRAAVISTFPDINAENLIGETRLAELPGWDSMSAINLVMELRVKYACPDLRLTLRDELSLNDIAQLLLDKGLV